MADRTISVRLRAVIGPYQAAMAKAAKDTRDFKQELSKTAAKGDQFTQNLGKGMLVAGGAVALGFGAMVSQGMNFEKQMSGVKAVSGATADQMKQLSEAALAAGASTKLAGVTASDAAAAEAELVKAGVSVDQVLGGALMGSLTLAAAGQLEFADAATIAAQAMNIFDLAGSDVAHVADVLAAAANKSAGDVGQFGDALRQGGLVASQTGMSLEETVGALAAFADNALIGSDAGTSLKTMLQRLTPQSDEAAQLMDELGFSAYDASGNFIGLEALAGELKDSLSGMTVEQRNATMATLFGSDAVRAANILYNEGAEGIREYVAAVDDQGAAAEMAAIQNDNLAGDIEALGGAIETVLIKGAGQADDVLRTVTQTLATMVNGFGSLEGPMGGVAMGFTGLIGAASTLGGAVLLIAPKISQAKKALNDMGNMGQFAARNMGKFTGALGIAGIAVAGLTWYLGKQAEKQAEAEEGARAYTEAILEQEGAIGAVTDRLALQAVLEGDLGEALRGASADLDLFVSTFREAPAGFDRLDDALEDVIGDGNSGARGVTEALIDAGLRGSDLGTELERLAYAGGLTADEILTLVERLQEQSAWHQVGAREAANQAAATEAAGGAADDAAPQIENFGDANAEAVDPVQELEDAIKGVTDAIRSQLDPLFAAQDAFLDHKEAQDAVKAAQMEALVAQQELDEAIKTHGRESDEAALKSLELAAAQQKVKDANRDAGRASLDASAAASELRMRIEEGTISLESSEAQLRTWVEQGLLTEEQAYQISQELRGVIDHSDQIDGRNIRSTLTLDAQQFWMELAAASYAMRDIQVQAQLGGSRTAGVQVATGGYITGPGRAPIYRALGGPSGTDTVPAWLSPGEYVVRKSAVDAVGLSFMHALNSASRSSAPAMVPAGRGGGAVSIDYDRLASAVGKRGANITIERGDQLDPAAVANVFAWAVA